MTNFTETDEFKKWFGNSIVVDKFKKPLIVFHGTSNKFSTFNTEPIDRGFNGLGETAIGSHFSEDKSIAECYPFHNPDNLEKMVLEVYLCIKNPKKYSTLMALRNDILDFCNEHTLSLMPRDRLNNARLFKNHLIKQGYDGVTYLEGPPYNIKKNKKRVWVAFSPTQIKIIDG